MGALALCDMLSFSVVHHPFQASKSHPHNLNTCQGIKSCTEGENCQIGKLSLIQLDVELLDLAPVGPHSMHFLHAPAGMD